MFCVETNLLEPVSDTYEEGMHEIELGHSQLLTFYGDVSSATVHVEIGECVSCRKSILLVQVEGEHTFYMVEYGSSAPVLDTVESHCCPCAGSIRVVVDVETFVGG